RDGQTEAAVRVLQESADVHGKEGIPEDWLFLALAHHHRGEADKARTWYRRAADAIRQVDATSSLPDGRTLTWQIRVEQHLLLREVEAILSGEKPGRQHRGADTSPTKRK